MEFSLTRKLNESFFLYVLPSKDFKRGWLPVQFFFVDGDVAGKASIDKEEALRLIPSSSFIDSGKRLFTLFEQGKVQRQGNTLTFQLEGELNPLAILTESINAQEVLVAISNANVKIHQRVVDLEEQLRLTQPIIKQAVGGATEISEAQKQEIAKKRKQTSMVQSGTRAVKAVKKGL